MSHHINTMWGNSNDGSIAGLSFVRYESGEEYVFLGSVAEPTNDNFDIETILAWGTKFPLRSLESWIAQFKRPDVGREEIKSD